MYSQSLLDHVQSPRNNGPLPDPDAVATHENPVCGDQLTIYLRITDGIIGRMCWQARGCIPALAAASALSEMLPGLSLDQARALDRGDLAAALGGLPPRKDHAALLAISTLRRALDTYTPR